MSDFNAKDAALGSMILVEQLLLTLEKANILPAAQIADIIRDTVARLNTTDQSGAGAAVSHYFQHWFAE
ncbi:hypothetical protein LMIY3S_01360 [Labrys miyagiensis]